MDRLVSRNVREVRIFMGLAGYYRRFVEGFSKIEKPITTLERNSIRYEWTKECDVAFTKLKELLMSALILLAPYMEDFTVCTNTSRQGWVSC